MTAAGKHSRRRCDNCGEPEGKGNRRITQLSTARLCQTCKAAASRRFAEYVAAQMGGQLAEEVRND